MGGEHRLKILQASSASCVVFRPIIEGSWVNILSVCVTISFSLVLVLSHPIFSSLSIMNLVEVEDTY